MDLAENRSLDDNQCRKCSGLFALSSPKLNAPKRVNGAPTDYSGAVETGAGSLGKQAIDQVSQSHLWHSSNRGAMDSSRITSMLPSLCKTHTPPPADVPKRSRRAQRRVTVANNTRALRARDRKANERQGSQETR